LPKAGLGDGSGWGVGKITVICLSNFRGPYEIPVPVVGTNIHSRSAL